MKTDMLAEGFGRSDTNIHVNAYRARLGGAYCVDRARYEVSDIFVDEISTDLHGN